MENIGNFLSALQEIGIAASDSFEVADLYEKTNMPQVLITLAALGRKVSESN